MFSFFILRVRHFGRFKHSTTIFTKTSGRHKELFGCSAFSDRVQGRDAHPKPCIRSKVSNVDVMTFFHQFSHSGVCGVCGVQLAIKSRVMSHL
ncbi:hypothetical protein RRG08_052882 [Elysia crispata]|uniref:Uncharacterized protein n=1 Tax=Elysia crispata TaxID=231223 RepID=A0AAE0ZE40_9GAST|nr:hypothetical protein RRG08_052882 [Elysia crispata]